MCIHIYAQGNKAPENDLVRACGNPLVPYTITKDEPNSHPAQTISGLVHLSSPLLSRVNQSKMGHVCDIPKDTMLCPGSPSRVCTSRLHKPPPLLDVLPLWTVTFHLIRFFQHFPPRSSPASWISQLFFQQSCLCVI